MHQPAPDKNPSTGNGEAPSLDENFPSRRSPLPAHTILKELYALAYSRGSKEELGEFTKRLSRVDSGQLFQLANGVENLIEGATARLERRMPTTNFIYGLFNCIAVLEATPLKERIEGLYGKLVPLARAEGTKFNLANISMAAGEISERCDEPEVTEKIYDEAIAAADAGGARFKSWMMGAYRFKLERIFAQLREQEIYTIPYSEIQGWTLRIMAVADNTHNKLPEMQASPHFIAAMTSAATGFKVLEDVGMSLPNFSTMLMARVTQNSRFSNDRAGHPRALLTLAAHYETDGDWGEALAMRIFAYELLRELPGADARRASVETWWKVMHAIDIHEFPKPGSE